MEPWRKVFRVLAGILPLQGLKAIREAIIEDDDSLLQGQTTDPLEANCGANSPCEGACLIGFAGWASGECGTVQEVEVFYLDTCCQLDNEIQERHAHTRFVNEYDSWPRDLMRSNLLPELDLVISSREQQ